jgi:hypothetical protein
MCGSCSLYVSALGNPEAVRVYCQRIGDYLSGSKPRMHSCEAEWWISCSRFRYCTMHQALRSPKFNQGGTIVLRAVDRDPISMVGMERSLVRKDGVAVVPLGDIGGRPTRARHIRARIQ